VLRRPIETTGFITTYLVLRLLVRSGFPNIYPDWNISITLTTNPDAGSSGKKSVKAGECLNSIVPALNPPPDPRFTMCSYFLAHVTGTVLLTRAS